LNEFCCSGAGASYLSSLSERCSSLYVFCCWYV